MRRARRGCTHAQGSQGFDSQSLFAMRKRPRPRPRLRLGACGFGCVNALEVVQLNE
jgi:hypothetical protein